MIKHTTCNSFTNGSEISCASFNPFPCLLELLKVPERERERSKAKANQ